MGWKDRITEETEVSPSWRDRVEDADPQGPLETYAETALDELSLGYYPQIAAGVKSIIKDMGDVATGTAEADPSYPAIRDQERQELQRGQEENPIASGLGTATAIAGQIAIPAGGAARVAKLAKSGAPIAGQVAKEVGKNMLMGSAVSGLKNPGDVEGEISPLQLEERLQNVIEEAPLNAAASVAGGLIDAKAAKSAAKAPEQIVKVLRPTPTKASVFIQNDAKRAREVGEYILSRGIVKPGDDAKTIVSKAENALSVAGKNLGDFIKTNAAKIDANKNLADLAANPTFAPERDLPELYGYIEESLIRSGKSGASDVASNVIEQVIADMDALKKSAKRANTTSEKIALNLEGLNQMKRFMQDQVTSYDKVMDQTKDAGNMSEGYDIAAKWFRNKVNEEISRFGNDEMGQTLKALNKEYSLASDARSLAQRYGVREFLKADPMAPIQAGLGTSAAVLALTKEPALAAGAGLATGLGTKAYQSISPTTKAAIQSKVPEYLSRNVIPKASAYYSAQESTPVLPPMPKTNIERAKEINQQRKMMKQQLGQ